MRHTNSRLWVEMKLVFSHGGWLLLFILPAGVLWLWLTTIISTGTPDTAGRVLEVLLPLVAALSAAPLMNMESQAGFAELRASYAEPWWRLPLSRSLMAALWTLLALGLGALAFMASGGSLMAGSVLPSVSPTLFLMGLSLLMGNLTQNYWAAMGVGMGIWFINLAAHALLMKNVFTASLFLFAYTWPPEIVTYPVNRGLLAVTGVFWFVLNSGWYWWTLRRGLRLYGSTA
jgi:hypothetical protein